MTAGALAAVKEDVAELGEDLAPLDLVLQHFPCTDAAGNAAVWAGLVEARRQGLTRAIGVSHFTVDDLQGIIKASGVSPAVNQVGCWRQLGCL